ncbi:MAG: hypothetical protein ACMXYL_05505 [Candidatus Woesearchaeota archaeon]
MAKSNKGGSEPKPPSRLEIAQKNYRDTLNVTAGYDALSKRALYSTLAQVEQGLGIDYTSADESSFKKMAQNEAVISEATYGVLSNVTNNYLNVGGPAAAAGRALLLRSLGINEQDISSSIRSQLEQGNLDAAGAVGENTAGRVVQQLQNAVYGDIEDAYDNKRRKDPKSIPPEKTSGDLARADIRKIGEDRRKAISGMFEHSGLEDKVNKP